jgi:hypothetical protein
MPLEDKFGRGDRRRLGPCLVLMCLGAFNIGCCFYLILKSTLEYWVKSLPSTNGVIGSASGIIPLDPVLILTLVPG